jgi:hypothetical protein
MTQKNKALNCSNCRIGDFKRNLCDCRNGFCAKYKGIGNEEDFFMTIEASLFCNELVYCWECKYKDECHQTISLDANNKTINFCSYGKRKGDEK